MPIRLDINELNLLCNNIAKELLEKLPPGSQIHKVKIKERYNIAHTTSSLIFAKLGTMGFIIEHFHIIIPPKENIKYFPTNS
jgi:hypothetical protein